MHVGGTSVPRELGLWSLISAGLSSCSRVLWKGGVRRVYCCGGCATKLGDVCVDAGISGTVCSTEIWECSSSSHSGCTRSSHAQDKASLTGSGSSQHCWRDLGKVNLSSGHKPRNFSPLLQLLSQKNQMVISVCCRPEILYALPSLKTNKVNQ